MAKGGGLTALEKRIVKALLSRGGRNQDIHALINYERTPTVNFGRISGVKKNKSIKPASDSASKGSAHIQFLTPDSAEGKSVHNVLQKYKISDELYPHKPSEVAALVSQKGGRRFTVSDHTEAWKGHKVRPPNGDKTNRTYCIFHRAYSSYTYNDAWVDLLVSEITKPRRLAGGDTNGNLLGSRRAEMKEVVEMSHKIPAAPVEKATSDGAAKA